MKQPDANLMTASDTLEHARKRYEELTGKPAPADLEQRIQDVYRRIVEGSAQAQVAVKAQGMRLR
jgi:hypothetical protein